MATWTTTTVNASYPNVLSMAQNRSTGQYMLAVVTAAAQGNADVVCRAYKSSNYGSTWELLENLFSNTTPYADGRDLNYATLQSLNRSTLYGCAISDDGKYQVVTQKTYGDPRWMWYSTDYGVMTPKNDGASDGMTNNTNPNAGWKWSTSSNVWPYDAGYLVKYTPGLYPVLTGTNGTTIWMDQYFTRPTGTAGRVAGKILTTRDRLNAGGVEFTMDVPNMFPSGYGGTPVYCAFFITDGKVVRKNTGTVLENGTNVTATIINPSGWPVSATAGGGVVVSSDNNIVYAARFVSGTGGGIWRSSDNGTTWTQLQSGINVNAIGISSNGQYVIAGPRTPTSGSGTFYLSSDSGATWTTQVVSFNGYINYLSITNDGKRAIGGANRTEYAWNQYSSVGYFSYVGPMTAVEQRTSGKTVAELIALSYSYSDIMGAGYTLNELIAGGIPITSLLTVYTTGQLFAAGISYSQFGSNVQWLDLSANANVFEQTYFNAFIDLSGDMLIRNDGALIANGDVSLNNITVSGTTFFTNDMTMKKRLFVGDDVAIKGKLYVDKDLTVTGQFSGDFIDGIIPTTAVIDYPTGGGDTVITGNVSISNDISFNGTTVDISSGTLLQVNGQVGFSDGSKMSKHDDLKSRTFDSIAASETTTTVAGVSQGQPILCSSDGKYVAINMGGQVTGATNYTVSTTGIDVSRDYGQTFTRKYINSPTDGTTPLYRPYSCLAISLTGQYMFCCCYGASGHEVSDNVLGFSDNYGNTWSSAYLSDLIGTGTETMYIRNLCISSDGGIMAMDIYRSGTMYLYKSSSKLLSGFSLAFTHNTTMFAEQKLKLITSNGFDRFVAQRLDSATAGILMIYDLSGTNFHTSTINYSGNTDISFPVVSLLGILAGPAGQLLRVDCREDFMYLPSVTDISNNSTTLGQRISSVQSPLGKHILIGPYLSTYNCPNVKSATNLKYSKNGGYTFQSVPVLLTSSVVAMKSVAISDTGRMYVLDDIGSGSLKYIAANFEKNNRDVTFQTVTVTGSTSVSGTVSTSDYRIKSNIAELDNNYTIDSLVPVHYNNTLTNTHEFGLVAHELQSAYPYLVKGEKDGPEYQRVYYNGIIGMLVKEVQDLKQGVAMLNQ